MEFLPKFRAFLKSKNKFVEVSCINYKNKYIEYLDKNDNNVVVFFKDIELSQYTDCLDVKEKEIASGDILKVVYDNNSYSMNKNDIYEVYFANGCFRIKSKTDLDIEKGILGYPLEIRKYFKIVGNKWKNPELIKER